MNEFYITPYRESLQRAGQLLSDAAFKTYMMLMSHVGDIATGYPGYTRLAELTRHSQTDVECEMLEIMRLGLVRRVKDSGRNQYGQWEAAVYQINPKFYKVMDEHLDASMAIWNASENTIEQTIEQKVPAETPRSKNPYNKNQNQNQNQIQESESGINNNNNRS